MTFPAAVTRVLLPLLITVHATVFSTVLNAHDGHCIDTRLGELMQQMKHELKGYMKALKQDEGEHMDSHLASLIALSEKARSEVPQKQHPDGTEPQQLEGQAQQDYQHYAAGMDKLIALLESLRQASGKDQVKQLIGQIKVHSKQSHKAFRQDCG